MLLARLDADPNVVAAAPKIAIAFAIALIAFFSHRENVGRLRRGNERRLGEPRSDSNVATAARTASSVATPRTGSNPGGNGSSAAGDGLSEPAPR